MFLRFKVANHCSIRDETELSFVAEQGSPYGRKGGNVDGLAVLPAAAIYGANASGKSSFLSGVSFMSAAVSESHRGWDPNGGVAREAFALEARSRMEPSLYEVDLILDGSRVLYGFELDDIGIVSEWIYAWPNGRRQVWLERTGTSFDFGRQLQGENRAVQDITRDNSLYLSAAAQNNHQQLTPLYRALTEGIVSPRTPNHDTLEAALASTATALRDGRRGRVLKLVKMADLGIEDVIDLAAATVVQAPLFDVPLLNEEKLKAQKKALAAQRRARPTKPAPGLFDQSESMAITSPDYELDREFRRAQQAVRGAQRDRVKISDLRFQHGNTRNLLTVSQESAGTLSWFALVGQLLDVMESGGLLCFDELDATLHPALVAEVVSLFQESSTNPKGAQLLAACHDTTVLSASTESHLRRDQVWLSEKSLDGATCLVPLSDFRVRPDQNLEVGYRQGRFGAIPVVSANSLASILDPDAEVA